MQLSTTTDKGVPLSYESDGKKKSSGDGGARRRRKNAAKKRMKKRKEAETETILGSDISFFGISSSSSISSRGDIKSSMGRKKREDEEDGEYDTSEDGIVDDIGDMMERKLKVHDGPPRSKKLPKKEYRFKCTGCGLCCTGQQPGNVFITEGDIFRISKRLKMGQKPFIKQHTRLAFDPDLGKMRYALRETRSVARPGNMNCEFLDDYTLRCRIYDVRPLQCRTYPFWPDIVKSEQSWEGRAVCCFWYIMDHLDA